MRLETYKNSDFDRGRSFLVEAIWRLLEGLFINSWLPGSAWRCSVLRLFGAKVGRGVVIKPRVRIKFPWKLHIGDHSWIGESVWIDNLGKVQIGSNCCISQNVYLCTGSHRWDSNAFDLVTKQILMEDHVWIGARSSIAPGTTIGEGAILTLGAVAKGVIESWTIYGGNPAEPVGKRHID